MEPQIDIIRDETGFVVEVALSGVLESDINVTLVGARLIIHAQRPSVRGAYLAHEIERGILVREISLPELVELVAASFEEGLLRLRLRKQEGA